jgi:competence protein ComEA
MLIAAVLALAMAGGASVSPGAGGAHRSSGATAHADELVDINRASVAELMKVPGMTSSWAGRIVRFRPYRAKSDLLLRGVLPSDVYDRIKDYVVAHREKR